MQDTSILNVDPVSDADGVDISPQDGIEPYAAIVSHDNIANDSGVIGKETILSYLRRESSY